MKMIKVEDLGMNNKAKAIEADGVWYLVSYNTVVAQCDGEGDLTMRMSPECVRRTTARHIGEFVRRHAKSGTEWRKAEVVL